MSREVWVVEDANGEPKRAQTFEPTALGLLPGERVRRYVPAPEPPEMTDKEAEGVLEMIINNWDEPKGGSS